MLIAPSGDVLPCHAARVIPDLTFENVKDRALREIWESSALSRISRRKLDAGTVQELRPPRDRFRRLPLPGHVAVERRSGDGPGMLTVAGPT